MPCAARAQTAEVEDPSPRPDFPWPCVIIIGCALAGGAAAYIVIHAYTSRNDCAAWHRLVLERDHYDGNWERIATNITFVSTNKMEVFRDRMTDDAARYRVLDEGKVQPPYGGRLLTP